MLFLNSTMIKKLKHFWGYNLINARGWKTKRRIVVIESDDWGAIRMPGLSVRNKLLNRYPALFNGNTYDKFDNLANKVDLSELFAVLHKYKDKNGKHPVITANTIVANPDFEKIKASGFNEYHYEKFTETLARYPNHSGTFEIWKQGITEGVFRPQLHGREHLNVGLWLTALKTGDAGGLNAFGNQTFPARLHTGERLDIAYNYQDNSQMQFVLDSITESAVIFEKIFGYKSSSFIAPSYTWCDTIEKRLDFLGIKYLQGGLVQIFPQKVINDTMKRTQRHYTGQKNNLGQTYLMRNVHFEPALSAQSDIVSRCLSDIDIAFKWNKPAIISSHRLNFIGNIEKNNRANTLLKLDELLAAILKKYPGVEFMSSDKLGDTICGR